MAPVHGCHADAAAPLAVTVAAMAQVQAAPCMCAHAVRFRSWYTVTRMPMELPAVAHPARPTPIAAACCLQAHRVFISYRVKQPAPGFDSGLTNDLSQKVRGRHTPCLALALRSGTCELAPSGRRPARCLPPFPACALTGHIDCTASMLCVHGPLPSSWRCWRLRPAPPRPADVHSLLQRHNA